jgi:tRNA (guanosine-2'-O-)-methyltransferase
MTGRRRRLIDSVLAQRQPDLTVLAERLHKPRNFSAIVRTCDAVGINEVHAVPGEAGLSVHWNTSQGAEKWLNMRPHEDLASACGYLRRRGFQLVAAHLAEDAIDYREVDYTVPTALVVGTELFGVSGEALALSDRRVMIPMRGMTQSLNVSVACAIVLYEAMRQREAAGLYGARELDPAVRDRLRFEWMHPAVARYCLENGIEYPALDEEGEVVGPLPRGGGKPV